MREPERAKEVDLHLVAHLLLGDFLDAPELPVLSGVGEIMRRLLRDVAEGRELGDTSTLLDPSVFETIRASK